MTLTSYPGYDVNVTEGVLPAGAPATTEEEEELGPAPGTTAEPFFPARGPPSSFRTPEPPSSLRVAAGPAGTRNDPEGR